MSARPVRSTDAPEGGAPLQASGAGAPAAIDSQNPWLGLASFTEETRQYFHGREEEVAELSRRVQRKLLTVLFGQSGLGKTSILRAGIVPRLRPEGYCPVYVRIDYSRESPTPAEQIKQAIFAATQAAGAWTQAGAAIEGESLWEFLHHRDDILRDANGKTLIPILIFDQFEEIFTLAQTDDFGRQRAAQFIEDLADLVENRAPKALEAKLEEDDASVEQFDFARADYRILIALREDYLAHLESVKSVMPSITQNRMRLARMTGQQALAAVMKPGGRLVSEEVAAAIVRFIAGGSELANAEVEPSLLSLICRELNLARIAQGRAEISADLLAGSRDTILSEFYERALADQPAGVRQVIEDNLLTESGFRESLAEERLQKAFAAAGAPADTLSTLVNRRLLRVEERLDVRRVELTHDVLCGIVRASRDMRLEREAREEAERKLAAQRARELATRKALVRARQIAVGCAFLSVLALAGAIFGYVSARRAQQAEAQAQDTRELAERARGEAEKLIVYLLDDFYLELEPIGRLDIVAALAKRAIDYYRELPPSLRTAETDRNRALAMVRYGYALRYLSQLDEAQKVLTEAVQVLEGLRAKGDQSEVTAIGYALGLAALGRTLESLDRTTEARKLAEQAADTLNPWMQKPASAALRRAYGGVANYQGFERMRGGELESAIQALEASRAAYKSIDDLKLEDLSAAAGYVEATAWQTEATIFAGRPADAQRLAEDGIKVAGAVLEKRSSHMGALRARALMVSNLGAIEAENLHLGKALEFEAASIRDWEAFLRLDPGNAISQGNLATGHLRSGFYAAGLGRLGEARTHMTNSLGVGRNIKMSPNVARGSMFVWGQLAALDADQGQTRQAEADLVEMNRRAELVLPGIAQDPTRLAILKMTRANLSIVLPQAAGDFRTVRDMAQAAFPGPGINAPESGPSTRFWNLNMADLYRALSEADYSLMDYAGAEKAARQADAYQQRVAEMTTDRLRQAARDRILLAMSLARQDRAAEAQQALAPALKYHRELYARHHDDASQHIELAQALYALAIADRGQSAAALREAAVLLDALPPSMRTLKSTTRLRNWIADEQKKRA